MGMLVLSRKKNEKVLLYDGDKILAEVIIVAICNNKVKLGFAASKNIIIDREEVFESKRANATVMKNAIAHRVVTKKKGTS